MELENKTIQVDNELCRWLWGFISDGDIYSGLGGFCVGVTMVLEVLGISSEEMEDGANAYFIQQGIEEAEQEALREMEEAEQ